MEELKTIKILRSTVQDLNLISAMTGEKQYEVVWRIAKTERIKAQKSTVPLSDKKNKLPKKINHDE